MLEERIYQDYCQALKAKEKEKSSFLSFIRSALKNKAIELRKEKLDDNEAVSVIRKEKKRILDAKETISSSQRQDLMASIEKELSILEQYLPQPLSDNELAAIIEQAINQTDAASLKDMGKVMKNVLEAAGARADSKKISQLVKERLSSL
ncbi:MAG: GatB/YqeY domain-containing protein [Candidatus Omnitrophica bacterium]|nr:GatB/YqeY domain-containing protein [Candidatus Omnitrophota bacterium]